MTDFHPSEADDNVSPELFADRPHTDKGRTDYLVHDERFLEHPAAGAKLGDSEALYKVIHYTGKTYVCVSIDEGCARYWAHLTPKNARRLARALEHASEQAERAALDQALAELQATDVP